MLLVRDKVSNLRGTRMASRGSKLLLLVLVVLSTVYSSQGQEDRKQAGAYYTGKYADLFGQLLGKNSVEVNGKIDSAFRQLFLGDDRNERVYYPVEPDMAFMLDVANNDVRTEGMSYGMMIAVQLDKREVFDRLWKWATSKMQMKEGPHKGYFAWHCTKEGAILDSTAASDGEEWFVTSLFFASARWGDGRGIFSYREQAQSILKTMLHKESEPGHGSVSNMFNAQHHLVAFVPDVNANHFSDPSYQLPHYYELWARWANVDNAFWCDAARASRNLLRASADSTTGLCPDYSNFDGTPVVSWNGQHGDFRFDAWRVGMNVAMDWIWFARDPWQVEQSNRMLAFFRSQDMNNYGNQYTLGGKKLADDHSTGLVAMNASASLASSIDLRKAFVRHLWDAKIPSGFYRYYDGMLYMLGMLQVSGNFRIYDPTRHTIEACSD